MSRIVEGDWFPFQARSHSSNYKAEKDRAEQQLRMSKARAEENWGPQYKTIATMADFLKILTPRSFSPSIRVLLQT